ncbi:cell wall protein RBR3-like, partial [Lucilia sericata]|uniref:cell wall protein RBR3-like n=1 Tax=Lucilia sericata TaxID=13632 RepID=UPI0018A852F7
MNSSHLVTPMNTHHPHHHNTTHHPHVPTNSTYTSKMPTSNNSNQQTTTTTMHNYNPHDQHAGLSGSTLVNKSNNSTTNTSTTNTQQNIANNVGAGLSSTTTASSSTPTNTNTSYKFAPARRLAARQTLRLAIPKQPGDSQLHSQLNSTAPAMTGNNNSLATQFKHSSPSQLPPAPILKRTTLNTPNYSSTPTSISQNSHIPKSASPLESHHLPNVLHHSTTPICTAATPSSGGSNKFLRVRNPSITLNSSDVCGNNDLFAFAKEFSSPAVGGGDHSPIFAEIASSISPSTASSGSPTNHLSRLFNLSPSTLRSYGNMSDFSDSSQSGVISPATSFIENFHKKNGTAASSANSSPSISTMGSTSPAINGGSGVGGGGGGVVIGNNNSSMVIPTTGNSLASTSTMGRQINTSSSSSSSVKETSSQQVSENESTK